MNVPLFVKSVVTHGLALGLALCLYTTVMWLTRLDTRYLATGQYLDIAVAALPVGVLAAAINRQRQ
jgi:predicted Kef-type K+ transport protein